MSRPLHRLTKIMKPDLHYLTPDQGIETVTFNIRNDRWPEYGGSSVGEKLQNCPIRAVRTNSENNLKKKLGSITGIT